MSIERQKFEKWYANNYPDPIPDYAKDEHRIMKDNWWTVWQAALSHSPVDRMRNQLKQTADALDHALYYMSRDQQAQMSEPTYEEAVKLTYWEQALSTEMNGGKDE